MRKWHVWESEYPDEGAAEIEAYTAKGAARRYRRMTAGRGVPNDTPLEVCDAERCLCEQES